MSNKLHIILAVTNELVYDQRMIRICTSLANNGYRVTLVGRAIPGAPSVNTQLPFEQERLQLRFHKGKLFYLEYNLKLYGYLIKTGANALCAIDLDTAVAVYYAGKKLKIPIMMDAHEYFTEMIEVKRRPWIHAVWKWVEKTYLPRYHAGYTVGHTIAGIFQQKYGLSYRVVRNIARYHLPANPNEAIPEPYENIWQNALKQTEGQGPIVLYQGALNEGRALDELIQAMHLVPARLFFAGTGNYQQQTAAKIRDENLSHKIAMLGNLPPAVLRIATARAYCGITIFDAQSLNQFYSLGNKFFDYVMAHKPQVCVNYPEYSAILKQYPVALPVEDVKPETLAAALNKILTDGVLYDYLRQQNVLASAILNWENEEKVLLESWAMLLKKIE